MFLASLLCAVITCPCGWVEFIDLFAVSTSAVHFSHNDTESDDTGKVPQAGPGSHLEKAGRSGLSAKHNWRLRWGICTKRPAITTLKAAECVFSKAFTDRIQWLLSVFQAVWSCSGGFSS